MKLDLRMGDCIDLMRDMPDASVDMICTDLPYGTIACTWDVIIPFTELWAQYKRIAKPAAAIVLTTNQPFTTSLIASNMGDFRYCWIWEKTIASNFMHAKRRPGNKHEEIAVFYRKQPTYNPQMIVGEPYSDKPRKRTIGLGRDADHTKAALVNNGTRYPGSVLKFSNGANGNVHPTQKPLELIEYLIRTYSNPGDTVLDSCMGSGTAGAACMKLSRKFIGMEKDATYFQIASDRIRGAVPQAANEGEAQPQLAIDFA